MRLSVENENENKCRHVSSILNIFRLFRMMIKWVMFVVNFLLKIVCNNRRNEVLFIRM